MRRLINSWGSTWSLLSHFEEEEEVEEKKEEAKEEAKGEEKVVVENALREGAYYSCPPSACLSRSNFNPTVSVSNSLPNLEASKASTVNRLSYPDFLRVNKIETFFKFHETLIYVYVS